MAPIANLYDPFNGPTISPQWTVISGTWAISGGTLCGTVPTQDVLYSTGSYSLAQSSAFVEVASYLNGAGAAAGLTVYRLFSSADPTDWVEIIINASAANITYRRVDNNVVQETLTEAYDATGMRWLRIRSTAGTTYFETAADGANWLIQFSAPTQAWASSVRVHFQVEQTGGTTTTKCFDNFNVAPASSRAVPVGSEFTVSETGELGLARCDQGDVAWAYPCPVSAYNGLRRSENPCGLWVQPPAEQHLDVEIVTRSTSEQSEQTIITLELTNPDTCRSMLYYLPLVAGMRMQVNPSEAEAGPDNVFNWALGVQVSGVDNPDTGFQTLTANDFGVTAGTHIWRGVADYYWTAEPGASTTVEVQLRVFAGGGDATLTQLQARLGYLGWSEVI